MKFTTIFSAAALLALAACNNAANTTAPATKIEAVAPPTGGDWTTMVAATSDGGYLLGNPKAPIKLVEYGSLTCPHCAVFSAEASESLKSKYLSSGKVSYEFRSYLLHGQDLMATMLVECGGPEPFFAMLEAAYAQQQDWLGKLIALPSAEQQRMQGLPIAAQNTALARASGLDQLVALRGVSREAIAQCLADPKKPDALLKVRDTANTTFKLAGTPTFIINGQVVENVAGWKELEPALRAAGA